MALKKDSLLNKAKHFLRLLRQDGIDVSEAYLFGSAVTGLTNRESDIDVAVVSKDFQGLPYFDISKISKHRRKVDLRLEIHPFSLHEVETEPPHFFMEIKKSGVRIEQ